MREVTKNSQMMKALHHRATTKRAYCFNNIYSLMTGNFSGSPHLGDIEFCADGSLLKCGHYAQYLRGSPSSYTTGCSLCEPYEAARRMLMYEKMKRDFDVKFCQHAIEPPSWDESAFFSGPILEMLMFPLSELPRDVWSTRDWVVPSKRLITDHINRHLKQSWYEDSSDEYEADGTFDQKRALYYEAVRKWFNNSDMPRFSASHSHRSQSIEGVIIDNAWFLGFYLNKESNLIG